VADVAGVAVVCGVVHGDCRMTKTIPRATAQTRYKTYRSTLHWRWVSFIAHLAFYPFLRGCCIMCNNPATQTHHRDYSAKGNEIAIRDLVPICDECHTWFSALQQMRWGRATRAKELMQAVITKRKIKQ